jgi:hypothetical protein
MAPKEKPGPQQPPKASKETDRAAMPSLKTKKRKKISRGK